MDRHGHVGVVETVLLDARQARSETARNEARASEYSAMSSSRRPLYPSTPQA